VFSPEAKDVLFAKRILEAMPDGSGAVMLAGEWKKAGEAGR